MQTQARNQVSILPILWQSCLACHVAVVYSLAKLSTACQVLRRLCFQLQDDAESLKVGVAECFEQANVCLAHYISQLACIDHLSAAVVPAAVFLLFVLFVFMLFHVWGLWAQVPQAEKEPSW